MRANVEVRSPSNQFSGGESMKVTPTRLVASLLAVQIAIVSCVALADPLLKLQGSAPPWANSSNFAGAADPNENIGFRVYLTWNNADGAQALAQAVSDPRSAQYGQYLTPAQFRKQFAPPQAQVATVQAW